MFKKIFFLLALNVWLLGCQDSTNNNSVPPSPSTHREFLSEQALFEGMHEMLSWAKEYNSNYSGKNYSEIFGTTDKGYPCSFNIFVQELGDNPQYTTVYLSLGYSKQMYGTPADFEYVGGHAVSLPDPVQYAKVYALDVTPNLVHFGYLDASDLNSETDIRIALNHDGRITKVIGKDKATLEVVCSLEAGN